MGRVKPVAMVDASEFVYLMLPGALLQQVDEFIRMRRGLSVQPLPDSLQPQPDEPDAMPIYNVHISQARWDQAG